MDIIDKKLNRKKINHIYYLKNKNIIKIKNAAYMINKYKTNPKYKKRRIMQVIESQKKNSNYKQNHNKYSLLNYYKKRYPGIRWKYCDACKRVLPSSARFYPIKKDNIDGLFNVCISCTNSRRMMKKYWNENLNDNF